MIELDRAEFVAPTPTGTARVLHPTSLRLSEQRIALVGANGSGKSTLARMLNGLVEPTGGTVRIEADAPEGSGSAPRSLDVLRNGAEVRRLVGFVFTDPAAQLVMPTPLEDVALSLRRQYPKKPERIDAARAVLADFSLEQFADRSVHTLSGGQKQMLAIATVLATSPSILIADEPTTLLDLRNSRLISDLLLGLPQQLVVATHDLDLAARCDRVIVMADGAVAYDSAAAVDGSAAGGSTEAAIDWYRAAA
jgi:biotin transport system ATP-binding protein